MSEYRICSLLCTCMLSRHSFLLAHVRKSQFTCLVARLAGDPIIVNVTKAPTLLSHRDVSHSPTFCQVAFYKHAQVSSPSVRLLNETSVARPYPVRGDGEEIVILFYMGMQLPVPVVGRPGTYS